MRIPAAFRRARLFERLGIDAYEQWARQNQTAFYTVCKSLIPTEQHHSGEIRMPRAVINEHHDS